MDLSGAQVEYDVTVHSEPDGSLWAEVPALPGCFAAGDTVEELRESLAESLSLYLSSEQSHLQVVVNDLQPVSSVSRQKLTLCTA